MARSLLERRLSENSERLKQALPRSAVLETLGRAALPVFCAHLVAVLLALALVGAAAPERPWGVDLAVLLSTFLVLWTVAQAAEIVCRSFYSI